LRSWLGLDASWLSEARRDRFAQGQTEGFTMPDFMIWLLLGLGYIVLMKRVLPRLGVPT
jgi:hypothetical protein